MLDDASRSELAARWAYRADLELSAAHRFRRLADRMDAAGLDRELVELAALAASQELVHTELCAGIARRFGAAAPLPDEPVVTEVAPAAWSLADRVVYELVAFCCVTETANAAVVTAGADDVDDIAIRRAVRTILADEVQHSRLGWRFLASGPLDDVRRAWLGDYLPRMLAGTIRSDLFAPQVVLGDEETMRRYGTLTLAERRDAFVTAMREVVFPGLARYGVAVDGGEAFLAGLTGELGAAGTAPPLDRAGS